MDVALNGCDGFRWEDTLGGTTSDKFNKTNGMKKKERNKREKRGKKEKRTDFILLYMFYVFVNSPFFNKSQFYFPRKEHNWTDFAMKYTQ